MIYLRSKSLDVTGILVYRKYQQSLRVLILLSLILAEAACNTIPTVTPTVTPTPTQGIIATFMLAVIRGQVVEEDVCLKIVYNDANMKDTLVFPPDASATIEGDQVTIVTGFVTGKREETVFKFGDWAFISGGELRYISEELLNTLPPKCQVPPYWVVGAEVRPAQPPGE